MLGFIQKRRQETVRERQQEALLLIDQLERAQVYLTAALGLETDDPHLNDEVAAAEREVAHLIQSVRRLRVV